MSDIKVYRCFRDSHNQEIWMKYDGKQIHTLLENNLGLNTKWGDYLEKQFNVVRTILWDSNRVYLNVQNVNFPEGFNFRENTLKYKLTKNDKLSEDGLIRKLFMEMDDKRGWAVFLEGDNKKKTRLIKQDCWDNVQKYIVNNFLLKQVDDFKVLKIKNFDKFDLNEKYFRE